jgi:hypothetical protein
MSFEDAFRMDGAAVNAGLPAKKPTPDVQSISIVWPVR